MVQSGGWISLCLWTAAAYKTVFASTVPKRHSEFFKQWTHDSSRWAIAEALNTTCWRMVFIMSTHLQPPTNTWMNSCGEREMQRQLPGSRRHSWLKTSIELVLVCVSGCVHMFSCWHTKYNLCQKPFLRPAGLWGRLPHSYVLPKRDFRVRAC